MADRAGRALRGEHLLARAQHGRAVGVADLARGGAFSGIHQLIAVQITVTITVGSALKGGEVFSIEHDTFSHRMYTVAKVDGSDITIRPPLREAIVAPLSSPAADPTVVWRTPKLMRSLGSGAKGIDRPMKPEVSTRSVGTNCSGTASAAEVVTAAVRPTIRPKVKCECLGMMPPSGGTAPVAAH